MGLHPKKNRLLTKPFMPRHFDRPVPWLERDGSTTKAGDETRTRDILLGRQALYQLSYSRIIGVRGLEPRTSWSQTRRATNCATPRYCTGL